MICRIVVVLRVYHVNLFLWTSMLEVGRRTIKVKENRTKIVVQCVEFKSRAAVRVEVVQSWVFEGELGQA